MTLAKATRILDYWMTILRQVDRRCVLARKKTYGKYGILDRGALVDAGHSNEPTRVCALRHGNGRAVREFCHEGHMNP